MDDIKRSYRNLHYSMSLFKLRAIISVITDLEDLNYSMSLFKR